MPIFIASPYEFRISPTRKPEKGAPHRADWVAMEASRLSLATRRRKLSANRNFKSEQSETLAGHGTGVHPSEYLCVFLSVFFLCGFSSVPFVSSVVSFLQIFDHREHRGSQTNNSQRKRFTVTKLTHGIHSVNI
jgi:hypothetical protein